MSILVEVTLEDIAHGSRRSSSFCPIALALNRATGESWCVTQQAITPWGIGESVRALQRPWGVETPEMLRAFVIAFDAGRPVAPFAFVWPEGIPAK